MKHITILATSGSNIGSIDNPRRAFVLVNEYLRQKGKQPLFKIQIAGSSKEIPLGNGLCTLYADIEIQDLKKTDLIIIPAFDGDIARELSQNLKIIPWLIKQYKNGAEIASLCVGAVLLGATGLLNGKSCSTHWRVTHDFKMLYPEVQLVTDKVITDENGLYTSGGAFSAANLILYIIEKYAGREIAIYCSKMFQVDLDRQSQSPFIIFQGQKDHDDEPVKQAQEFIENNYQDKISVDKLTSIVALSRRNLERRFKKATTNTVVEYIQRVKIEAAKKFFESSRKNINEVMYDVGYSDTKAFRNVFKKITGLSPIEYRNKYNKEAYAF
ncbi:MAG: helix-turn-helix domain-containing protein [Chitinophagaceae bacterium]|nr:MAG: helix-turn-helix domain-containing protein [Chitinophagaceae bacterium]